MRITGFDSFEGEIGRSGPGAALLVCGSEQYQAGRLRAAIREHFTRSHGFEYLSLSFDDLQPGLLTRTVSSRSLFAPGRLVRLAEADRCPPPVRSEILAVLESGREDAILVETSDTSIRSGFNAKLDQHCVTYICWEPFESDLPRWCDRLTREAGLETPGDVRAMLVAYSAGSLSRLAEAVERCSAYLAGRRPALREVASLLSAAADADIFELSDMVLEGRFDRSLRSCWRLVAAGEEPVGIVAFLFRQWQRAEAARAMIESGEPAGAVERTLGLPRAAARKLSSAASARRRGSAAGVAEAFARADHGLKTGADPYLALAALMQSLTRQ